MVATYAQRLSRRGHEVIVAGGPEPLPSWKRRARVWIESLIEGTPPPHFQAYPPSPFDELQGVRVIRVPHPGPFEDRDLPDADVVIATWWETAEWVARLAPSKGAKVYFIQGKESTIDGMPSERVEATLRLPLFPITVSEFLLEHLKRTHGRSEAVLVPNPVDLIRFNAPPRGKARRPTLSCVYTRGARIKGFDIAIAAIFELRRALSDLQVLCFGFDPPPRGQLPSFFEFFCNPPIQHIVGIYASSDLHLHTSRVEGFGLPILEAMACGTPVVATPAGAAPELLRSGGGILARSFSPFDVAQAAYQVLTLPEGEWRELSRLAWKRARRHSIEDATSSFEEALLQALSWSRSAGV
ncbi:MAG: glycosyltransferase family 4 protein [Deltaproteobacteria bacterium]|nr:glycosyltransferase family 4 protein [Deltaproteobacteria bacterium]